MTTIQAETARQPTIHYPNILLLVGLALGGVADWLFVDRWLGVSAPLFVALCLGALLVLGVRSGRRPMLANLWLGGAALFFAGALAVRDEPMVVALNILAVLGLLLLQVAHYRGAALLRSSLPRTLGRVLAAVAATTVQPPLAGWEAAQRLRGERARLGQLWPVLRGLLLAAPVLGCFTLLLASADSVFASYVDLLLRFELPFDVDTVVRHTFVIGLMSWLCAGALLAAIDTPFEREQAQGGELPAEGATQRLRPPLNTRILGAVESLTVLALVDGLFASFMLVQAAYFFGGLDTLARTGVTYAEYARRGFFELLAVACLSLALLWVMALLSKRELPWQRWAFNGGCAIMIVLVVGMLASAFQRMLLYEEAYGFTRLRLYTHSFMLWLAVVLALFLVALLRERPRLWSYGTCVAALVYLAALNISSPDAIIVRANIARYAAGGELDAPYLATLSADAAPALVEALPLLDPTAQQIISDGLQAQQHTIATAYATHGWPSWHWARWQAAGSGDRGLGVGDWGQGDEETRRQGDEETR